MACCKVCLTMDIKNFTNDEEGDESFRTAIEEQQSKALIPLTEDVADWLSKLLGRDLPSKMLFEDLKTGTVLCELAHTICHLAVCNASSGNITHRRPQSAYPKSTSRRNMGGRPMSAQSASRPGFLSKLPPPPLYRHNAQPSSFLARDNAANFITWCRQLGIDNSCMFESEGLVLMKEQRNIILCLLEIARIAGRYGIVTPELIVLEQELEREEILKQVEDVNGCQTITTPLSLNIKDRKKVLKLDDAIHNIVDGPPFEGQVNIERVGEGMYNLEGKLIFVRMLRGRHVMVRVGGGWDTLEHYLIRHSPAQFVPQLTSKQICDSILKERVQSARSGLSTVSSICPAGLKPNKNYFVPVAGRYYARKK